MPCSVMHAFSKHVITWHKVCAPVCLYATVSWFSVLLVSKYPCAGVLLQARDPIPQLKKYILEAGLMSEGQIKDIEKEVLNVVDEAVKFADESPKPVSLSPLRNGQSDCSGWLQLVTCAQ